MDVYQIYIQKIKRKPQKNKNPAKPYAMRDSCGAPGGIRTPDLLVRSQALYPAELQAHIK